MSNFYKEMVRESKELIDEYGFYVDIIKDIDKDIDPVTGEKYTEESDDIRIKGLLKNIKIKHIDGTKIKSGDKFLIIAVNDYVPTLSDIVMFNNLKWRVKEIDIVSPGDIDIVYVLRIRR